MKNMFRFFKKTTFDFQDGNGPVPAHRHTNGGGWVANTAKVTDTAYVGPDARVYGDAVVYGNAQVSGNVRVYGNAVVFGSAEISGNVEVYGNARVIGSAEISGNARVYGDAVVSGNAWVYGTAVVSGTILTANRSDGYTFTVFKCQDGQTRITAGCRYFTIPEAIDHWTNTRGGTKLGKESIKIVNYLGDMLDLQEEQQ